MEIWERTQTVIRTVLYEHRLTVTDLAALGVTNQRETTVVWNRRTGRPYRNNAIVWQDTRTDRIASADQLSPHNPDDLDEADRRFHQRRTRLDYTPVVTPRHIDGARREPTRTLLGNPPVSKRRSNRRYMRTR